ncbi:MAG: ATP synthase subunit I [Pseudanabaenaceae cyanobacterium bins.68]|nr:ATP synthase subunit I [Pseudanabaenaceae cyanobacterium bins.68]
MKILPALSGKPASDLDCPSKTKAESARQPPTITSPVAEYDRLKQILLRYTLGVSGLGGLITWLNYGTNITLSYLIGAAVGLVYLRQLGKSVDRLGSQSRGFSFGSPRLALVIGMIVIALKWQQLSFLPVFLGFLTYKFAILIYAFQSALPDQD